MLIQVHTNNHVAGGEELTRHVEAVVGGALGRFGDQVTRAEVHLNDENSAVKHGGQDKRCTIEARLAGLQPIAVSHDGATLEQALDGAADKLERALDRTLGRLGQKKGRTSYGGDQAV